MVTLLSPSPTASRRAQEALETVLRLDPVELPHEFDDELDSRFISRLPGQTKRWDSVASVCPGSGSLLHFVSLRNAAKSRVMNNQDTAGPTQSKLSLLSIHDNVVVDVDCSSNSSSSNSTSIGPLPAILSVRDSLASSMESYSQTLSLGLKHTWNRPIEPNDVLGFGGGLPFLSVGGTNGNESTTGSSSSSSPARLKEVTVPHFDDAKYTDGRTLLERLLENKHLQRPVVGLFQLSNDVVIRPLPTATEDRNLSEPSLVFCCPDGMTVEDLLVSASAASNFRIGKIGYTGQGKSGQYMLSHTSLPGLSVRLTEDASFSSSFAEAQDSLLAASLEELQSVNVLQEGGSVEQAGAPIITSSSPSSSSQVDPLLGVGDCWIEVRANIKNSRGYFKRNSQTAPKAKPPRIASVPDIPYE